MKKIALQLYSIKDISAEKGIFEALKTAKELGYDGVEFAGFFDKSVVEIKAELDRLGLEAAGAHIGYDALASDIDKTIADLKLLGAYSVCVPHYKFESKEDCIAARDKFEALGKKLTAAGIKFGYHNHTHEYSEIEGKQIIDYILEADKDAVFYELDTRHAALVHHNPVVEAIRYTGRIPVLHARDTDMTRDTAVGAGVVDFSAVVKEANCIEWFVVENENFGTNIEELRDSAKYLRENFCK